MKYCAKCGSQLDDSVIYCSKCGTKQIEEKDKKKYQGYAFLSILIGFFALILLIGAWTLTLREDREPWKLVLGLGLSTIFLGIITMITGFLGGYTGKIKIGNVGFYIGLISIIGACIVLAIYW